MRRRRNDRSYVWRSFWDALWFYAMPWLIQGAVVIVGITFVIVLLICLIFF